jgi:HD superfamily phosphohydrolase YqeK
MLAQKEFKVEDPEILSAIRWHTLGKENMTDFEKIIFLADKIEERTRPYELINPIKNALNEENGLDKALLICYGNTIKSLVERNLKICKITVDIYNDLLNKLDESNGK